MAQKHTVPALKTIRLQRAWSQDQLAEVCDLSVRTIQRIENGGPASFEKLKALAAGLDMSLEAITVTPTKKQGSPADEKPATADFLVRMEKGTPLF
jgi:transcriptional regulator with XRE-family HTH domain